jgi:uncharacterized protein (TIGR03437 family)
MSDTDNARIRKISNGVITTVAGNGTYGFSGDNGPATSAQLYGPVGVAVDSASNVYVADSNNNRIRLLQPPLSINPGGILNAASSAPSSPVAPGSIATVYGSFLIPSLSTASGAPLPTSLADLSLEFTSGPPAPLFAVSSAQINFQVPWELADQSQTAISASINGQTSPTQTLNLATYAPGLFSLNSLGSGPGAILDSSYNLVGSSNPATAGVAIIQIYCTGLGPVTNQPPNGSPPSGSQTLANHNHSDSDHRRRASPGAVLRLGPRFRRRIPGGRARPRRVAERRRRPGGNRHRRRHLEHRHHPRAVIEKHHYHHQAFRSRI